MKFIVKGGQAFWVPPESRSGPMVQIVGGDTVPAYLNADEINEIMHGIVPMDEPAPEPVLEPPKRKPPKPKAQPDGD